MNLPAGFAGSLRELPMRLWAVRVARTGAGLVCSP